MLHHEIPRSFVQINHRDFNASVYSLPLTAFDPRIVRREVRCLYADGACLNTIEIAFELDRTALLRMLRCLAGGESETNQARIDDHLARDGYGESDGDIASGEETRRWSVTASRSAAI